MAATALPFLATLLMLVLLPGAAWGHAKMSEPPQRGTLASGNPPVDPSAPIDYCAHCQNGGGRGGVFQAAGGNWQYYKPLDPNYRFVAGLCGDPRGGREAHRKGGKFFYGGKRVRAYRPGQTIEVGLTITAHHKGYVSLYMCNLDACGTDDIEEKCFRQGHCKALKRARDASCDSGNSEECGPIDPNFPGRFYLPCDINVKMRYQLPPGMRCRRCVLQWYWATANSCNPRGTTEYFSGPYRPKAWTCLSSGLRVCGSSNSPEEFWGCADVSIGRAGSPVNNPPTATPLGPTSAPVSPPPSAPSVQAPAPRTEAPRIFSGPCVRRWSRCGGIGYQGSSRCCPGLECITFSQWYSQCDVPKNTAGSRTLPVAPPKPPPTAPPTVPRYEQCGGDDYTGPTKCTGTDKCVSFGPCYSQCRPA